MSGDESSPQTVEIVVPPERAGVRLDWFLAQQFPVYSRVALRRVINAAGVKLDGARVKAAHRVQPGQRIVIQLPPPQAAGPQPEDIPLEVLYEDGQLAVINKPPAMVVHPGRGHWSGTLSAALQFHFDELSAAAGPIRPGIVHRLDRDTSGVMVVAKNDQVHMQLAAQFESRTVEKEYFALVAGEPNVDRDVIDLPIGIHPYQREKMAIRRDHVTSKHATSYYEVTERFEGFAAVKVLPKTGRTHQIRLHLASIHCPVLCDRLYGGRSHITRGEISRGADDATVLLDRQALHARRLKITHPTTGEPMEWTAPLPADIESVLESLRKFRAR